MTTATPARVPGLTGCLPPLPPGQRLAIGYVHEYLGAGLGQPDYPVDVTGGIGDHDWGMLGNGPDPTCTSHPDGVGDCTFAGREHYHYAKAAGYGLKGLPHETSNALVAEYLKYDHGRDQGAVIAWLLMHWYRAGLIAGFAPVDHTDPAGMDAATQRFKGLYCGVQLTPDAQSLFAENKPWNIARGQRPDPNEGHCILKVGATGPAGFDEYVTWGAGQKATAAWSNTCVTEAWVVILHEDELEPAELAALQADLDALAGHVGRAERRRSHLLGLIVHLAHQVAAGHQPASVLTDLTARFRL